MMLTIIDRNDGLATYEFNKARIEMHLKRIVAQLRQQFKAAGSVRTMAAVYKLTEQHHATDD